MMRQILFLTFFLITYSARSQQLEITVSNIRNNKGQLRFAFYNNAESFDKDKPALFFKTVSKSEVRGDSLHVTYGGIPSGIYGIALLDDENSNQEMDYRLFLPTEGFGFSDYYHTGMTRPKFEKFKFVLGSNLLKIHIKIRYL